MTDNENPRRVWWTAGIPVAWLITAFVLLAESARTAGLHGVGAALDVTQFLIYVAWFRLAWRASRNIRRFAWRTIAQGALATGLVLSAML